MGPGLFARSLAAVEAQWLVNGLVFRISDLPLLHGGPGTFCRAVERGVSIRCCTQDCCGRGHCYFAAVLLGLWTFGKVCIPHS